MAIEVETKDCSALEDVEVSGLADVSSTTTNWEPGLLSKQVDEWVLVSQAFVNGTLEGYLFTTLERIGGTPALLIGLGHISRTPSRTLVLKALMTDQSNRALMAFPDEDVLVATRLVDPGPLEAFVELDGLRPDPGQRLSGEERAWGRRLAKRFGAIDFDDQTMIGNAGASALYFDHESLDTQDLAQALEGCSHAANQYLLAWAWATPEYLEQLSGQTGQIG